MVLLLLKLRTLVPPSPLLAGKHKSVTDPPGTRLAVADDEWNSSCHFSQSRSAGNFNSVGKYSQPFAACRLKVEACLPLAGPLPLPLSGPLLVPGPLPLIAASRRSSS